MDDVNIQLLSHREVATKHQVSVGLVGRLVKAYKRDPTFIDEVVAHESGFEEQIGHIADIATELSSVDGRILSTSKVQQVYKERTGCGVPNRLVSRVLKEVVGMSFTKVRKVPHTANSGKNLVLRQLYAKKVFSLMDE